MNDHRLVNLLAKQLEADLKVDTGQGLTVSLEFDV